MSNHMAQIEMTLNGEKRTVEEGMTVAQLLTHLSVQPERVAVEVNLTVLKRAQHSMTVLQEGDQVELVQFIGGGT